MQTTPQLLPLQLLLLLAFKCLLAMCHSGRLEYKCARSVSPQVITLNRRVASVQLNLSIASNGNSSCHALIRGPVRIMTRGRRFNFLYARLIGKLKSQQSVLALSSEFGPNGIPVATVTASNQTQFRAFASPSASMYARLSGPSADSVLLDIELVKECPAGWSHHNGACYGTPSTDTPAATFREASTGCRHVRSNLAMELETGGMAAGAADATVGGGDGYQSVWIGAAVSGSRAYFLDGKMVDYGDSIKFRDPKVPFRWGSRQSTGQVRSPRSAASSADGGKERHCVYYMAGALFRLDCDRRMRYLCSRRPASTGDHRSDRFYTLDEFNLMLSAGSVHSVDFAPLSREYFAMLLIVVVLIAAGVASFTFAFWLRIVCRTTGVVRLLLRRRRCCSQLCRQPAVDQISLYAEVVKIDDEDNCVTPPAYLEAAA